MFWRFELRSFLLSLCSESTSGGDQMLSKVWNHMRNIYSLSNCHSMTCVWNALIVFTHNEMSLNIVSMYFGTKAVSIVFSLCVDCDKKTHFVKIVFEHFHFLQDEHFHWLWINWFCSLYFRRRKQIFE